MRFGREGVSGRTGIDGDVGRPWRRFRLREPEVRDGSDRWGRGSHLSAKGRGGRLGEEKRTRGRGRGGAGPAAQRGKEGGRAGGEGIWAEPEREEGEDYFLFFLFYLMQ